MIPYGKQDISQADIDAVIEVLRSDWITQGPVVRRFERALADYCGAKHALTANSATSALHLACRALDLGPGDTLWTSPITFVASANCALYCGADIDFVDIDPGTFNMSTEALDEKLRRARDVGKLPKIVVPVHFGGQSCDMRAIRTLAERYGFRVIEDASHAIGGKYEDQRIGSCRYSDITILSFHPVKIITTCEGGAALTNDPVLLDRLALLCSHGITRDETRMDRPSEGPWYYQQIDLGYNFRMNDVQAALGLSQLDRVDEFVGRRAALSRRYDELLNGLPVHSQVRMPWASSAHHLYVIRVDSTETGKGRNGIFHALRSAGVGVNVHYIPIHLQPYYRHLGFKEGDFPRAENYYREALTLPLFYGLTDADQDRVIDVLKIAVRR
jgi:UDP-4-amino-4,6-dideoxy-N-acetyl-beta-L-altrosamine transaminase